jgi:hypothetical protein
MITYTEKGRLMHKAIADAGHSIKQRNRVWITSDDAAVQQIIDNYPLSATIAEVKGKIDKHAAELRDKAVAGISRAEMASWPIKRAEMLAYNANLNASDAPILSGEATVRGVTLDSIAARVQANESALIALEIKIAGMSGKHKDAVSALTTFADVLAYDWSGSWPEV